jgi:enoyl-CoA hydratase/carnithine racemase
VSTEPVRLTIEGHRADIALNRPDVLNAMDVEVFDRLAKAADEVRSAPGVRVLVVSGEGKSFSSGIDTSSFGAVAGASDEMIGRAQAGFRKIGTLPMPTIAAVKGHAYGAGLQLALACDIRVVTKNASLGLLEHKYGILPDLGGTQQLPRVVGPGLAKLMIWTAERINGEEAARRGIAEISVEPDDLDTAVDQLAERIASAPPRAVRAVKRLVDLAGRVDLEEGMDGEAKEQAVLLASADFSEAITAFMEKRLPNFTDDE